jgi:3-oxoacyl-[acyl-carrier protein] reductase
LKKTVLVTGAARGIGLALAEVFVSNGWNVIANVRNLAPDKLKPLQDLKEQFNHSLEIGQADVTVRPQVDALVNAGVAKFGTIDLLINNAGVAQSKLFIDLTEQDWDLVCDTNLKGVFYCSQSVLRYMLPRKEGQIINISSIWGMVGASCEAHYAAAKAGVIGLTKSLAKELGPSKIRVNCIAPGIIETDMLVGYTTADKQEMAQKTPLQRLGTPREIAELALFLASEQASFITGQVISPNGGIVI